jgi:hypothetical protein
VQGWIEGQGGGQGDDKKAQGQTVNDLAIVERKSRGGREEVARKSRGSRGKVVGKSWGSRGEVERKPSGSRAEVERKSSGGRSALARIWRVGSGVGGARSNSISL